MLLSRHKDKWTSCLLIFLSVSWPGEILCVGYLRHKNQICTDTDQWMVGVVISKNLNEQSVGNVTEAGQLVNSNHVELKEELD